MLLHNTRLIKTRNRNDSNGHAHVHDHALVHARVPKVSLNLKKSLRSKPVMQKESTKYRCIKLFGNDERGREHTSSWLLGLDPWCLFH